MCGLSAILMMRDGNSDMPRALQQMTDVIRHRGPDDEGYVLIDRGGRAMTYRGDDTPHNANDKGDQSRLPTDHIGHARSNPFIGLGHRRLSIVDLSPRGHQPMTLGDGAYWIVFNGEIYNHPEIADELKAHGITLSGHSDTEVLLNAYKLWGRDCLQRFNGMFSFVIVDLRKNRIFAARDRFGIKPLYYWIGPQGTLAFASEIKQFTVLPGWRARLNQQRVYDYLAWSATDHCDETLFRQVFQFRPGQALSLSFEQLRSESLSQSTRLPLYDWYKLVPVPFSGSLEDAGQRFHDLLRRSVELRLRSDVPVGTCLSGGLDSSSIVALVNELLDETSGSALSTFSACWDIARFDERKWIDIVVAHTKRVKPHFVYPDLDRLFDELPKIAWHQDEPFNSSSIYAQWNVFKLVSQSDVKVMLDGQGADEQLAGYDNFFGVRLAYLLTRLKWFSLLKELHSIKQLRGYSPARMLMLMADNALPNALADWFKRRTMRAIAKPDWIDISRLGASPIDPLARFNARGTSIRSVNYSQTMNTNLQKLLHFEDRNSMAHSIEARVPFLDHNLVEFVLGLPDDHKLANGITKRVLRQGLKGVLPEPIRMRMDKLGFQTPEEVWMRKQRATQYLSQVKKAVDRSDGIITQDAVAKTQAILDGKRPFSWMPWTIIALGAWMDAYDLES